MFQMLTIRSADNNQDTQGVIWLVHDIVNIFPKFIFINAYVAAKHSIFTQYSYICS